MLHPHVRVLQGFRGLTDAELVTTAGAVITGLTGNTVLSSPTVDPKVLQSAADNLNAAIAAQAQGGTAATAHKHNQRAEVVSLLTKLAHYVQDNCNNDPAVVLSSGFQIAASTRARSVLPKAAIVSIDNGQAGELVVKVTAIPNAKAFEVHFAPVVNNVPGAWQSAGAFTNSQSMIVTGLTSLTTYVFQVRAVGGSTRYGDWSDPVAHLCI